jgi:hypothetical protein
MVPSEEANNGDHCTRYNAVYYFNVNVPFFQRLKAKAAKECAPKLERINQQLSKMGYA